MDSVWKDQPLRALADGRAPPLVARLLAYFVVPVALAYLAMLVVSGLYDDTRLPSDPRNQTANAVAAALVVAAMAWTVLRAKGWLGGQMLAALALVAFWLTFLDSEGMPALTWLAVLAGIAVVRSRASPEFHLLGAVVSYVGLLMVVQELGLESGFGNLSIALGILVLAHLVLRLEPGMTRQTLAFAGSLVGTLVLGGAMVLSLTKDRAYGPAMAASLGMALCFALLFIHPPLRQWRLRELIAFEARRKAVDHPATAPRDPTHP